VKGSTITLTATVSPTNATSKTVTWSVSSGSSYASVNSSTGVVTGLAAGSATIKATAGGKSATKTITVTASTTTEPTTTDLPVNNTVTAGATDGTSLTGTQSTYTATGTSVSNWNTLVWSDEFEGTSLKTANWKYETGNWGWGNNEKENYTTNNATVAGGVLDIVAKSDLTSARIKSAGLKTFKYGKIQARIKCDQGTGSWPAYWMLGTCSSTWPQQGEIDILEHANNNNYTLQTCHWSSNGISATSGVHASYGTADLKNQGKTIPTMDVSEWHVYTIEWTSSHIDFYVDSTKTMAIDVGNSANGLDAYNYPFYFIFNFAIGGDFPQVWSGFTNLPWHMYVDYVRVYQ
jgi:beta-glucanase (GH16 family)